MLNFDLSSVESPQFFFRRFYSSTVDANSRHVCREFKLGQLLQRKCHIKIELYCKLVTLYKLCEVCFRLIGTNDFHVKAENDETFSVASSS